MHHASTFLICIFLLLTYGNCNNRKHQLFFVGKDRDKNASVVRYATATRRRTTALAISRKWAAATTPCTKLPPIWRATRAPRTTTTARGRCNDTLALRSRAAYPSARPACRMTSPSGRKGTCPSTSTRAQSSTDAMTSGAPVAANQRPRYSTSNWSVKTNWAPMKADDSSEERRLMLLL